MPGEIPLGEDARDAAVWFHHDRRAAAFGGHFADGVEDRVRFCEGRRVLGGAHHVADLEEEAAPEPAAVPQRASGSTLLLPLLIGALVIGAAAVAAFVLL